MTPIFRACPSMLLVILCAGGGRVAAIIDGLGKYVSRASSDCRRSRQRVAFLQAACFLTASVIPSTAPGVETYHSRKFGYSVNLPDGWVTVPAEIFQKTIAHAASNPGKSGFVPDAAFQKQGVPWFDGLGGPSIAPRWVGAR
jgi:hypothetical protein